MKNSPCRLALTVAFAALFLTAHAFGEMSVSVTINGPIEDIVALLQHLKDLGIGSASAPSEGPYKVTITSVATTTTEPEPVAPPPPPKPTLELLDAKADPAAVKPGGNVLLTVKVSDPDHVVDTVAATVDGTPGSTELYDNGTQGDAAAGDGIWSATLTVAPQTAPGEHAVNVAAFNTGGNPVMKTTEGGPAAPLTAQVKITVQP